MKKITIIVPVYNEEAVINIFYSELKKVISALKYEWEILFVDDGSKDKSLALIKKLREQDKSVCYIEFSRNFGKESAMLAGLDYATGDCAIIMDADLQDPPTIINDLIDRWLEGYEDVYARRKYRGKESIYRRFMSIAFYEIIKKLSKVEMISNVGDFRLLDRKCIEALKSLRENERYSKGLFNWIGFKKCCVEFDRANRVAGETKWCSWDLFKLAFDGIFSFSVIPLRLASLTGSVVSIIAFVYMVYVFVKALLYGDPVAGYPSLMIVILFLGGLVLLCLGIIGEYVGRIYSEVKKRPVYLVRDYNSKI